MEIKVFICDLDRLCDHFTEHDCDIKEEENCKSVVAIIKDE